jgi:flavorubredoxin
MAAPLRPDEVARGLPEGDEDMNVLVAYASKYGATRAIAERLADRLSAA